MLNLEQLQDLFTQQGLAKVVVDELCRVILKNHAGEALTRQEIDFLQLASEYMLHIKQERNEDVLTSTLKSDLASLKKEELLIQRLH